MRHDEEQRQIAIVRWWDMAARGFGLWPEHLWHTPNGGKRSVIESARMKRMGVRRGVPDLFLAVPRHDSCGLFVEMKTHSGRTSAEQDSMLTMLQAQGYECCVCRSADEAVSAITRYLRTGCAVERKATA